METSPALNTQQDWIRQPLLAEGDVQKDSMVMLRELTTNQTESNRLYNAKNGLSKTLKSSGQGSGAQTGNYLVGKKIRRLTPVECERLQGFPDNWTKNGIFAIPEDTKQGYAIAKKGDSINLAYLEANKRRGRVGKGVAGTIDTGVQQYTLAKNNLRRLTPIECERLQGFKDNWTSKGLFDGETKEISDSQRYKMLGNAVSVPVVEAIAMRLKNNSKEIALTEPIDDLQLLTLELQLELLHFKTAA